MAFGLLLGDLTYLTAVLLGLALVAQTFGTVFLAVKWLGVVYLAWLAWTFWTTGITPETSDRQRRRPPRDWHSCRRHIAQSGDSGPTSFPA
jgi:threonine/homoserine/homoserine lactone efflux protein